MIVNKYQGNGGGGGGSYVLLPATANRLGGIKVGSGVTITNDGTLSAEEATVIDLAVLSAMTSADRVAFWDEVYGKVSDGKSVFMKGLVYGEADRTAILPVVSFRPETSAVTHEGGNIFFGAKGDTDNIYFHINFGSDGSISPTDGMVKTFIAGKASTETMGLVKVGSGLTIDASGVLSISGGTAPSDYNAVKEQVSANTENIETLSGVTSGLTEALSGKQGTLSAGNGIDLSGNTVSVKIGDGLAFSGDTLIVSGGTGGNSPRVVFLNKLTEQERIALYNELASKYDYNASSWTTAFTQDDYAFYIDLREYSEQQDYSLSDEFEGFFPMQVVRMHPSDYGGGAFFSGVAGSRYGQAIVINIRFVITYDGQVDHGTWWNSPGVSPEYVFNLDITSAGTISWNANWEAVADTEKWTRMAIRYYYDIGLNGWQSYATAPVKWIYNYATEVDSEVKLYYILTADINIKGTVYTGVWGVLHDHWYGNGDPLCPKLISWTSGSTITDPSYPPYIPNV